MRRTIAAVCALGILAASIRAQQLFTAKHHSVDPTSVLRVIAVDIDADLDLDLVACGVGTAGGTVHVLTNDGTGSFKKTSKFTTTGWAFSLHAADFDLDGDADLAVGTGYPQYAVEIFENLDGKYSWVNTITAPNGEVTGVVARDLDGDAAPDLAVCEQGDIINCVGPLVRVHANAGGFQFTETGSYGTQCQPFAMTAGDFDGAGGIDLATADRRGNAVTILLNDGAGGFGASTFSLAAGPYYIHAADFDADGFDDLAVAVDTASPGPVPVEVLWSSGSGFTSQTYSSLREVGPIQSGDFDGDGDLDLLAGVDAYPHVPDWFTVLRNLGNRSFSLGISHRCAVAPRGAVVADLDPTNPLPDVAIAEFGSQAVGVFLQSGVGWPVLELSTSASFFWPSDTLTITTSNGAANAPLLAAVLTLNGVPTFLPIALTTFDAAGQWQHVETIPSGLSGVRLEFAVFGFDVTGPLSTSNWSELAFF